MVFENGAYGSYSNAASFYKILYNEYTSGIKKDAGVSKIFSKSNGILFDKKTERHESNYAYISREYNDTGVKFLYEKRITAAASRLSKKRKLTCKTDASREDCKRRKMTHFAYQNNNNFGSMSFCGRDLNTSLNHNTFCANSNKNSYIMRDLYMNLYDNPFNLTITSEDSTNYNGQTSNRNKLLHTREKNLDAKSIPANGSIISKKVKNTKKLRKKEDINKGNFLFFYDKINKTTRLIKQKNVRTTKRKRGQSTYNLENALSKMSVKTLEEIKIEFLIQDLAKFKINI
ncbi:hypothetical protein COBT_002725 [Conglomerata obtusa]